MQAFDRPPHTRNLRIVRTPAFRQLRTAWISDLHLGTRSSKTEAFLQFLRDHDFETLYIVGDLIDAWQMKRGIYWPQQHNDVIQKLLRKARKGTRIIYIPGNHDEMFRAWLPMGLEIAGIRLRKEAEHLTADCRRLLVMHGDEFDSVVRYAKFLAFLGDWAYNLALNCNRWFNAIRRRLGYPYWSLSAWLKRQVKEAVKAMQNAPDRPIFQALLFSKIVPNCKKLGLLDAGDGWLRDRFTELGVIQFEDWVDTGEEYGELDQVAKDREAAAAV
jgi:UDP-2,3-diacylglucosamine pyrophosphatase LpxH